jgi:demethylmenaquinone methyltransferase / 2-methoxy-6-polyprenyl-1,4-benzoquinol methylase
VDKPMDATLEKRKTKSFEIFNQIASTYDFLNHLLSFGIDKKWRKKLLLSLPRHKNKLLVLDLATGTGDLAFEISKVASVAQVSATDLSEGMLEEARKKKSKMIETSKDYVRKVGFAIEDGCNLSFKNESFDATTVSFGIRNFPSTSQGLSEIYRVLKPGGRALILEFSLPKNFFFRHLYFLYFRYVLPFVGNLVSKHKDAYKYLNRTVEDYPYGASFEKLMLEAGFKNTSYQALTMGICTLYIGEKI